MFGFRFTSDNYDEYPPVTAMPAVSDFQVLPSPATAAFHDPIPIFSASSAVSDSASIHMSTGSDEEIFSVTRAKIASHPLYPKLLQAYIDFQKVKDVLLYWIEFFFYFFPLGICAQYFYIRLQLNTVPSCVSDYQLQLDL